MTPRLTQRWEPENQIITDYEVYARRPNDSDLLVPDQLAVPATIGLCTPPVTRRDLRLPQGH